MRDDSDTPNGGASSRRRGWMADHRRTVLVAVLGAAAAVAPAAFSATSPSHAATLATRSGHTQRGARTHARRGRSRTSLAADDSTGPLQQWATCERAGGDPNQGDPTVEHQVIYIAVPMGALANWDPTDASAPCGSELAAARSAVAGGRPVSGWGDNALYVQYANCMRANGYPTFPYPSGKIEPDGNESTDFNGTGIDPNSPDFLNGSANQSCGKQIGAPAWWINNWGPPGSVDAYPAGTNPNSPFPAGAPQPSAAKPAGLRPILLCGWGAKGPLAAMRLARRAKRF